MPKNFFFHLLFILTALPIWAQDPYPDPIPQGDFALRLEAFATIPDSSPGDPPRMSLMTTDPSGRLFVNDQDGPLYWVSPLGDQVTKYLDLRDYAELEVLNSGTERGFQSFAFHPDFTEPNAPGYGLLYTMHSSRNTAPNPDFDPGGDTFFHSVLLEWKTGVASGSLFTPADAASPYREVLRLKQPGNWHNVGLIAFNPTSTPQDPDYGNLYIGVGDGLTAGDPQGNGQDTSNPYGALLRIDPLGSDSANGRYGIAGNNAFAADSDPSTIPEIYAYGFRNPQRFSWDANTGDLYLSDIGEGTIEELNHVINGGNYGWNLREGSLIYAGGGSADLIDPIAEYDRRNMVEEVPTATFRRAISTGEVLRGFPSPEANGHLIFSDLVTGLIFTLDVDNTPLTGGQNGIRELKLIDANGFTVRFLDAINTVRADRGLAATDRADARFSLGIPGSVFLLNKQDGLLRRLAPVRPLHLEVDQDRIRLDFYGTLESSTSLNDLLPLSPQPQSPWILETNESRRFFRLAE